jgi:hypothetical protein
VSATGVFTVGVTEPSICTEEVTRAGIVHPSLLQSHAVVVIVTLMVLAVFPPFATHEASVVVIVNTSVVSEVTWVGYCVVSMVRI